MPPVMGVVLIAMVVLPWVRVTIWRLLQLLGAVCLIIVVLTHVAESFEIFPAMGWGLRTVRGTISIS